MLYEQGNVWTNLRSIGENSFSEIIQEFIPTFLACLPKDDHSATSASYVRKGAAKNQANQEGIKNQCKEADQSLSAILC